MKRIADLDADQMTPPQRAVYDEIVNGPRKGIRGPLSVWLHRPELGQKRAGAGPLLPVRDVTTAASFGAGDSYAGARVGLRVCVV